MLIEKDFMNVTCTALQTNILTKVSALDLGPQTSLMNILTEKKGAMQSRRVKISWAKSTGV